MFDLTRPADALSVLRSIFEPQIDPAEEQRVLKEAAVRRLAETSPHLLDDIGVRAPKDW